MQQLFPLRRPPQECTRVLFPCAGIHATSLVDSSRVRWVLCAPTTLCPPSFPRRGACAGGRVPRVHGVPVLGLLRPIRHSSQASRCRPGAPPASCPPPCTACEKLPVFSMKDANGMMEVACCWLPRPLFAAAPSPYRGGQVALSCQSHAPPHSGPYSCLASTIAGLTGWHQRQGRPGPRFPVGLCTLPVLHQVMPPPSTTAWGLGSPAWRLAGACCSHPSVVSDASLQGLIGYL